METDYPEHPLAREPAPRYEGEGPFALWHFSEDASLGRFRPRVPAKTTPNRLQHGLTSQMVNDIISSGE